MGDKDGRKCSKGEKVKHTETLTTAATGRIKVTDNAYITVMGKIDSKRAVSISKNAPTT